MKTRYRLIDADGDEFKEPLSPFEDIPVEVVSVQYWHNNDPDDTSEDEIVVTLRYLHEISDEDQKLRIKWMGHSIRGMIDRLKQYGPSIL